MTFWRSLLPGFPESKDIEKLNGNTSSTSYSHNTVDDDDDSEEDDDELETLNRTAPLIRNYLKTFGELLSDRCVSV